MQVKLDYPVITKKETPHGFTWLASHSYIVRPGSGALEAGTQKSRLLASCHTACCVDARISGNHGRKERARMLYTATHVMPPPGHWPGLVT